MSETTFISIAGREYTVETKSGGIFVNGELVEISDLDFDGELLIFRTGTASYHAVLDRSEAQHYLLVHGRELPVMIETPRDRLLKKAASAAGRGVDHAEIKAAMPGLVVKILAQQGAEVKKGEPVMILEAMKMENEVRSPVDGVISEIRAVERGSVEKGDVLIVFD